MLYRQCYLMLLILGSVMSSTIVHHGSRQHRVDERTDSHVVFRTRRQAGYDGGSILNDIFQIPIQTLSAVGQLFMTAKKQRDKRRHPSNDNNANNYNNDGYNAYNNVNKPYNNGNNAYSNGNNAYSNGNNAYSNGNNAYNSGNKPYNNGNNAYNNGNNAYSSGHTAYNSVYNSRPLISAYTSSNSRPLLTPTHTNNIGANAFNTASSNGYTNSFNRPLHYLSQLMSGLNRGSRTHGAKVAGLTRAEDGSSFKI